MESFSLSDGYVASTRELGKAMLEKSGSRAVRKYLLDSQKKRNKLRVLCPTCMEIVISELKKLEWGDECLEQFVKRMFEGADISQLQFFVNHYKTAVNKTSFFISFIRNEL